MKSVHKHTVFYPYRLTACVRAKSFLEPGSADGVDRRARTIHRWTGGEATGLFPAETQPGALVLLCNTCLEPSETLHAPSGSHAKFQ